MTPTPDEIRLLRVRLRLTQTEAANLVGAGLRSWQNWESPPGTLSHRKMSAAVWELFNLKTARRVKLLKFPL